MQYTNRVRLTILTKNGGPMSKTIFLDTDGKLTNDNRSCSLVTGQANVADFDSPTALAQTINSLRPEHCLTLGVADRDGPIVTKKMLSASSPDSIARTQGFFRYHPGVPGVLLLDHDSKGLPFDTKIRLPPGGALEVIMSLVPGLADAGYVFRPSTSSGLFRTDTGETFPTSGGWHLHVMVLDQSDIPRALRVLYDRLWLAGWGFAVVHKLGAVEDRTLVDASVGAPERPVFEGAPVVVSPLAQDVNQRAAQAHDGPLLDTRTALPDLTVEEAAQVAQMKRKGKVAMKGAAAQVVKAEAERTGRTVEDIERANNGNLPLSHVLYFDNGRKLTVEQLMHVWREMDGETLADPLEPEVGQNKAMFRFNAGAARIDTFLHGGGSWRLDLTPEWVSRFFESLSPGMGDVLNVRLRSLPGITDVAAHREWLETCPLDSPDTIAHAAVFRRNRDLRWDMLEERARKEKVLTAFAKATTHASNAVQVQAKLAETPDRFEVRLGDPNNTPFIADRLIDEIVVRHSVLAYGGNPVVIQKTKSPISSIYERDIYGNKIVDDNGNHVKRPQMVSAAVLAQHGHIRSILYRMGYFTRYSENNGWLGAEIPPTLVGEVMAVIPPRLNPIKGLATYPVMLNGKMYLGSGGFNAETQLYLSTGDIEIESWTDPKAAYRFLVDEWLSDFPFDTPNDALGALMLGATLLTAKTETAKNPLFVITAPNAGTGKSYMQEIIEAAITGKPGPVSIYDRNADELQKLIVTALMQGNATLHFDNMPRGTAIGDSYPALAAYTTSESYIARILGGNTQFNGPASSVLVVNGNNIALAGDMRSRGIEIRLVSKESAMTRKYKHANLTAWTLENRGRILGAYACIMSQPQYETGKSRFPRWVETVADPIIKASGVDGYFDTWDSIGNDDLAAGTDTGMPHLVEKMLMVPEIATWGLASVPVLSDPQPKWTAAELYDKLGGQDFATALGSLDVTKKKAAWFLGSHADRIVDTPHGTFRFVSGKKHNEQRNLSACFWLERA